MFTPTRPWYECVSAPSLGERRVVSVARAGKQAVKGLFRLWRGLLVPATILAFASLAGSLLAQERVGSVSVVGGTVSSTSETAVRELTLGDSVFAGETIETGPESAVVIVFDDESEVTLGPDSRLVLDALVFDPELARFAVTLTQGTMKFDSGNLPDEAYEVLTPAAAVAVGPAAATGDGEAGAADTQ